MAYWVQGGGGAQAPCPPPGSATENHDNDLGLYLPDYPDPTISKIMMIS